MPSEQTRLCRTHGLCWGHFRVGGTLCFAAVLAEDGALRHPNRIPVLCQPVGKEQLD